MTSLQLQWCHDVVSCNVVSCHDIATATVMSYSSEADAQTAMMKFNARWYGGKQLSAEFVSIDKWKNAICGRD